MSMAVGIVWSVTLLNPLTPTTAAAPNKPQDAPVATSTAPAAPEVPKKPEPVAAPLVGAAGTLSGWLDKLATHESGNRAGIKVLDVNGRYSYGCLQFQMGTWLSYGKALGANEENIYDCALQRRVASSMIHADRGAWRHWGYTVRVHNLGIPPVE